MPVRDATLSDAAAIQRIYAPIVADTAISLEELPPDIAEIERRMTAVLTRHPHLVFDEHEDVVGYAYASEHKSRWGYRASIDVTVYIAKVAHRRGIGRALLAELLHRAAERGYHAAVAAITLPNDASVGLHEALGFTPVGVYREVGRKFDAWHDVGVWQRLL